MRVRRQFDVFCDAASKRLFPLVLLMVRLGVGSVTLLGSLSIFSDEGFSSFAIATFLIGLCLVCGLGMRLIATLLGCWFAVLAVRTYGALGPNALLLPAIFFLLATSGSGYILGFDGLLARTRMLGRSRLLQMIIGPAL